jgi:hypothetical protein
MTFPSSFFPSPRRGAEPDRHGIVVRSTNGSSPSLPGLIALVVTDAENAIQPAHWTRDFRPDLLDERSCPSSAVSSAPIQLLVPDTLIRKIAVTTNRGRRPDTRDLGLWKICRLTWKDLPWRWSRNDGGSGRGCPASHDSDRVTDHLLASLQGHLNLTCTGHGTTAPAGGAGDKRR